MKDFFVLKISFGCILLVCGLGLWILEVLLHDSQYLNYYCAFFAGLQNGFLTHNRLKLRKATPRIRLFYRCRCFILEDCVGSIKNIWLNLY